MNKPSKQDEDLTRHFMEAILRKQEQIRQYQEQANKKMTDTFNAYQHRAGEIIQTQRLLEADALGGNRVTRWLARRMVQKHLLEEQKRLLDTLKEIEERYPSTTFDIRTDIVASGDITLDMYGPVLVDEEPSLTFFLSNRQEVEAALMERALSSSKSLSEEKEQSARAKTRKTPKWQPYKGTRPVYTSKSKTTQARARAKAKREHEERQKREAEDRELTFRRRQLDRYAGDLKALDTAQETIEEVSQFLEDFAPRNTEEEVMVANIERQLERVKASRE